MTPKRARFALEYLVDLNATAAARRAGWPHGLPGRPGPSSRSRKSRPRSSARWTRGPAAPPSPSTARSFELARVGFSNLDRFIRRDGDRIEADLSTATEDDMAAVSEITQDVKDGEVVRTRIKLHPKVPALQELVKHLTLEAGKPTTRDDGQPRILKDITDEQLLELMILRRQEQQRLLEEE